MAGSLLRRAIPPAVKRRHERWITTRGLRFINEQNEWFAGAHGTTVLHGPFAGLRYARELMANNGDFVPKLVGSYEQEVYPVLERWAGDPPERIVNVGAAEGFYTVGLARLMPNAGVVAYEMNPAVRATADRLAEVNGVQDRIDLRGECTPAELASLDPAPSTALLCDCEGAEADILDPGIAPVLRGWRMLVELHDDIRPGVTDLLRSRFSESHEIEMVPSRFKSGDDVPELAGLSERERRRLLAERPAHMEWASFVPRS